MRKLVFILLLLFTISYSDQAKIIPYQLLTSLDNLKLIDFEISENKLYLITKNNLLKIYDLKKLSNKQPLFDLSNTTTSPLIKLKIVDDFNAYLYDYIRQKIYILDEYFEKKEEYSLKEFLDAKLDKDFFVLDHNSVAFTDKNNGDVFLLTNALATKIIDLDSFKNCFLINKKFYILMDDEIKIYSSEGIFLDQIPQLKTENLKLLSYQNNLYYAKLEENLLNLFSLTKDKENLQILLTQNNPQEPFDYLIKNDFIIVNLKNKLIIYKKK